MNLTIRHKLYGLGLLGLAIAMVAGITGLYGISDVAAETKTVSAIISPIRNHLEARQFLDVTRTDVSKIMTASGDAQDAAASELADHQKPLTERFAAAALFTAGGPASDALHKEKISVDAYLESLSKVVSSRTDAAAVGKIIGGFFQTYTDLRNQMDNTDDALQGEAKRAQDRAVVMVRRSKIAITSICLISSLVLMLFASKTARGINVRMAAVIQRLKSMAAGDLTLNVDDTRKDELGEIARWFNDSLEKLRDAIGKVALSAGSVTTATQQLTSVSNQMTANSEETTTQASAAASTTDEVSRNLNTVAAGTEEMNTSIRQIASNVNEASKVARQAVEWLKPPTRWSANWASLAQKSAKL